MGGFSLLYVYICIGITYFTWILACQRLSSMCTPPPQRVCHSVTRQAAQGRRHEFLSGGTNRRQVANLSPKYPKNRKRHRIWATSFTNQDGTPPPKFDTGGDASPPSPPPPLSTPMRKGRLSLSVMMRGKILKTAL